MKVECEWTACRSTGEEVGIDGDVAYLCPVHQVLVSRMVARRNRLAKLLEYIRGRIITPSITKDCWRAIR